MINEGLKKYLQNSKVINLAVLDSVVDREIEKAAGTSGEVIVDEDTARFVAGQLSGDYQTKLKLNPQNLKDFDFSTDYNSALDSRTSLTYSIDFSEITIPKEVEKIGKYCFWMSSSEGFRTINFESIENLKEIGDQAFKSRERTVVNIKNKDGIIEKIGQNAFYMPTTGDSGLSIEEHYNKYLKDLVENSEFIQANSFGNADYCMTEYHHNSSQGIDYEVLGDTFFFRSDCYADENGNGPWNNYKKIGRAQQLNWSPNSGTDPESGKRIITLDGNLEIIGGKSSTNAEIINIGDKVRKIADRAIEASVDSVINIGSGIEKIEDGAFMVPSYGGAGTVTVNIKAKSSDHPEWEKWFNYPQFVQMNFLED